MAHEEDFLSFFFFFVEYTWYLELAFNALKMISEIRITISLYLFHDNIYFDHWFVIEFVRSKFEAILMLIYMVSCFLLSATSTLRIHAVFAYNCLSISMEVCMF